MIAACERSRPNASSVGRRCQDGLPGTLDGQQLTVGDNDYNVRVKLSDVNRRNMHDVKNLLVSTSQGSFVRLGDIADVRLDSGPTRIDREDRQRQLVVYANTVGISSGELIQKIERDLIPQLNMELGYRHKMIVRRNDEQILPEIARRF